MKNKPIRQITQSLRSEIDSVLPKIKSDQITILYIDDEKPNLRAFKGIFRKSYFKIHTAQTLEEGFKILATEKVHIIITDYEMPIHKGDHVLKMVLTMYPNIIPVVLSAYLTREVKEKLKRHFKGITLIEKPFIGSELEAILKGFCSSLIY
jgi:response regulator RpfG family c-di-GMP phosphodiesterase